MQTLPLVKVSPLERQDPVGASYKCRHLIFRESADSPERSAWSGLRLVEDTNPHL